MSYLDKIIEAHQRTQQLQIEAETRKLQQQILKHSVDRLKIQDQLENRKAALETAAMLQGQPAPEVQTTAPEATSMPYPGQIGPGPSLGGGPQTTVGALPLIPIPGVTGEGINIPSVSIRPQSQQQQDAQTMQQLLTKLKIQALEPYTLAEGGQRVTPSLTGGPASVVENPKTATLPALVQGARATIPGYDDLSPEAKLKAIGAYATAAKGEPTITPHTVTTEKGVFQWNPQTNAFDIYIGPRPQPASSAAPATTDAKDIAGAIISGIQPPTLTGLYRNAGPVRAELARQGYDLTTATKDWQAVQKHLATLNGQQQERLRQAITFTSDSLDIISDLYSQWKKVAGVSGFKVLNKGALAASKQLPGEAGAVASNLEAQINDLTSELATVYKGGNASTDEGLRLAAANLKADWNETTFTRALDQIRKNLTIRKNSILNSQPVGVSSKEPAPTQPQTLVGPNGTILTLGTDGKYHASK